MTEIGSESKSYCIIINQRKNDCVHMCTHRLCSLILRAQTCRPGWVPPARLSVCAQGMPSLSWWSLAHRSVRPPAPFTRCLQSSVLCLLHPKVQIDANLKISRLHDLPVYLLCCLLCWHCKASFSGPATSSWYRCMASSRNRASGSSFCGWITVNSYIAFKMQ